MMLSNFPDRATNNNSSAKRRSYFVIAGLALLFGLFLVLMFPKTTHAQSGGGVGSGGTGGGGGTGAEAHYTYRGWGWATYATSGPGPRDGFRNGQTWANAQSVCSGAGASTVIAHIIMDSYAKAKIYDYLTIQTSPYVYGGNFAPGYPVDDWRAVTITTADAQNAFNSLPSYGVSTAGYSFGSNVAWFCYNFSPPPPPPPPPAYIVGRIFNDRNANGGWDAGEELIQNAVNCGSYLTVPSMNVNISGVGQTWPNRCNPEPFYQVDNVPSGSRTVSLVPPPGWRATTGGQTINVTAGGVYHIWFGAQQAGYLDGVKIDDSGVSALGSSSPEFGGRCYINRAGFEPYCGSGSLLTYPFSNDQVCVSGHGCTTDNWFSFNGITPGPHNVTLNASGNGSQVIRGFSICESGGSCTSAYLTTEGNITQNTNPAATSMTIPNHNFVAGRLYHMRWIFSPYPPTVCTPASQTIGVGGTASFSASGGSGTYGWSAPTSTNILPGVGSSFTRTFNTAGVHTVTLTSVGASNTTCTVRVANRPYFKVFRGDVASCNGTILGFNRGSSSYGGASSQLAALALGVIDGFVSASTRITTPVKPVGLTLANTGVPGSYGGSFSADAADLPCPDDYAMTTPTGTFTPDTNYTAQDTVVHNGDLYINGNLEYGSWSTDNVAAIPSLTVVVNGNIYIDDNVTRLDGVYIAQESGPNTGQIFTCAESAPNNLYDADELEDECDTKLTFNGSVIAKKIHLLRTNGDVRTATGNERSGSGTIAEVFNYSPAVWLTAECNPTCSPTATDAIYALPPIP